jgi:phytol kinase
VTVVDLLHVLLLLAAAAGMITGLRFLQQRRSLEPELVRKMFHVGGGILGLTLPWLFDSIVPVLVLAVAIAGGFLALRMVGFLRTGVGQVLHAVRRESIGEFCYVGSLLLLFWLARGDKLLFSIPLLILALADTFAAMIGEQYGRLLLRQEGIGKSYEGVAAFFLTAFFCVHVPVLLAERTGRLESLLIGAGVSVMVMMAEAAAWWGLDNLVIPLFSYMLLKAMLGRDALVLASDIAFFLTFALFMRLWRGKAPLADDALFGATLVGYVIWTVGGWLWALAPLTQLATYALLVRVTPDESWHMHRFPVVLAHVAGSAFWLLLYAQSREPSLLLPFATCYGANSAIMGLMRLKARVPGIAERDAISIATARGLSVVLLPVLAQSGLTIRAALDFAGCLVAIYVATVVFCRLQPNLAAEPIDAPRWIRQVLIVAAASTIAIGSHYGSMPRLDVQSLLP